jgi:hypothetical protein
VPEVWRNQAPRWVNDLKATIGGQFQPTSNYIINVNVLNDPVSSDQT